MSVQPTTSTGPDETGPSRYEPLTGDPARSIIDEDAFGLGEIVKSIAQVVQNRVAADGYAIGIEGRWGSGKTTLLNFVEQALKADPDSYRKVIRLDPWLVGDKRNLLRLFLSELAKKLDEYRTDARVREIIAAKDRSVVARLDRVARAVERYSSYLDLAADGSKVAATVDPSLYIGLIGAAISFFQSLVKCLKKPPPSLDELKADISSDLQAIKNLLVGASVTVCPHFRVRLTL